MKHDGRETLARQFAGLSFERMSAPHAMPAEILGENITEHLVRVASATILRADEKVNLFLHLLETRASELSSAESRDLCVQISKAIDPASLNFPERGAKLINLACATLGSKIEGEKEQAVSDKLLAEIPIRDLLKLMRMNQQAAQGSVAIAQAVHNFFATNSRSVSDQDLVPAAALIGQNLKRFNDLGRGELQEFAHYALSRCHNLPIENRVSIVESLATAGLARGARMEGVVKGLERAYPEMGAETLAKLATAASKANFKDTSVIRKICAECLETPDLFSAEHGIAILFAATNLRADNIEMFRAVASRVNQALATNSEVVSSNALAKFVWCCGFLGRDDLSENAWHELSQRDSVSLTGRNLKLALQASIASGVVLPDAISETIHATQEPKAPELNTFESEVLRATQAVTEQYAKSGAVVKIEPQACILGSPCDLYLEYEKGSRIGRLAIECDGVNYHRVAGEPTGMLLAKDAMTDFCRRIVGIDVIRISSAEWFELKTDEDKVACLKTYLDRMTRL